MNTGDVEDGDSIIPVDVTVGEWIIRDNTAEIVVINTVGKLLEPCCVGNREFFVRIGVSVIVRSAVLVGFYAGDFDVIKNKRNSSAEGNIDLVILAVIRFVSSQPRSVSMVCYCASCN